MTAPITQEFKDELPPVRIDSSNGDGRIITIVDWASEASTKTPTNATNIQWSFSLEYLAMHHYFPSLARVLTSQLPGIKISDSDEARQAKAVEFKRKYSPTSGHAVQFLLWRWFDGDWRAVHSGRDWIQYLGLEGHISLIFPYFLDEPGVMFGGTRHKIGMSIHPRYLEGDDYIEINGGYSGSLSYIIPEPVEVVSQIIEGSSGSKNIGLISERVLLSQSNRAALYLSNAGSTRLYFNFSNAETSVRPPAAPFLESGESLTYENGNFYYSGGNSHLLSQTFSTSIIKLPLNCARLEGSGLVSYQQLIYS